MEEWKNKMEENFIYNEKPFYVSNEISTKLAYSNKEDKYYLIRKCQHKIKANINSILHSEINKEGFILKLKDIVKDEDLCIIQEMEDFIPLKLFIQEDFEYLYILMKHLIKYNLESKLFQKISEFIDLDILWIDKNLNIKICWLTFLTKHEKYFDNSIFKTNINNIEGIINLFNYNKKRLQKRPSKNITIAPSRTIQDSTENFFKFNANLKLKPEGSIQYSDKIMSVDKGSVRVCGTKKLCIENIKGFCKSREDKNLNFMGVKLILLRNLFKEEITLKNADIYISKLREIYKTRSNEIFNLSDKLIEVIKFIIDLNLENIPKFEDCPSEIPNEFVIKFVKNLKKFAEKEKDKNLDIIENLKMIEPLENIFEEKGFNMADFNTKTYKKGRFYVCQAVPNLLAKTSKPNVDLNKIFQIIEIQNKQIEMMYQTLKEKNNIDQLIDAQLESLSLQANEMLTDLDKNEE